MNLGGTWIAFSRILGDEHEFTIKFAVDVQFAPPLIGDTNHGQCV